jgi:hypothetical protein
MSVTTGSAASTSVSPTATEATPPSGSLSTSHSRPHWRYTRRAHDNRPVNG